MGIRSDLKFHMGRLALGRCVVSAAALIIACSSSSTVAPEGAAGAPAPGGSGGEAGSASGGAGAGLCSRYCDTMEMACTGDLLQYETRAKCLEVCAALPDGSPDMVTGNSVHCRLNQAEIAIQVGASEAITNCPAAGPSGNGVCGETCEAYCSLVVASCQERTDAFTGETYEAEADCLSECEQVPVLLEASGDPVPFFDGIREGNSLQCRLWHVQAAAIDPATHCGHALGVAFCDPDTPHSVPGSTGGSAGAAGAAGSGD